MARIATCSCGQLRVTCEGEPHRVSICNCLECQRRTGSAFGINAWFRDDQLKLEGQSSEWQRVGDEGGRITFHFCPTCGSTVHWTGSYAPGSTAVAVGAFADRTFPGPTVEVYEERRHPWLEKPKGILLSE
jgi:hypothetical protein